jgi:hypothetical protein
LTIAVIVAVLIAGIAGAYWWANTVPSRPQGVSGNAVFLWAPYVGFPGPRRGWWLVCWEADGRNRCQLNGVDGSIEYEGEFVPYRRKGPVPASQLKIDPTKTREHKVWVGDALVPLVYLDNGEILIPTSQYEEGRRLLDQLKSSRQ